MKNPIDKWLLGFLLALVLSGALIFVSAALGLLAGTEARFSAVIFSQGVGLTIGFAALVFFANVHYKLLQRFSFYIFLVTLAITALVFVPGLGAEHGGATRWLALGAFSFQPAELLKIGFVLYFAAWLAAAKRHVSSFAYGFVPLTVLTGLVGFVLLAQPDTGTFAVIMATALAMFIAGGGSWIHFLAVSGIATVGLGVLVMLRPYVQERIMVFLNPAIDPQGSGYQLTQSLIAIGSGGLFGRGFGQSVQKFYYLPEPISDSVFAVFAEEFGFIGGVFLLTLFAVFTIRGISIGMRAPDYFGRLAAVGIVILIAAQASLNIGSMLGVFPLSGLPLPFVSHGGTALIANMAAVGIVLNISRYTGKG